MDVILELGGNTRRLYKAVELADQYPQAKIVVSSEGNPDRCISILRGAGIRDDRFVFDFNAWDTVTNFIGTLNLIKSFRPKKVYVVTDKFHMKRSMAIARGVFFLSFIKLIPCPYMGSEPHDPEPAKYIRMDRYRAWLWRLTGHLKYFPHVKEDRMPTIRDDHQICVEENYPVTKMRI